MCRRLFSNRAIATGILALLVVLGATTSTASVLDQKLSLVERLFQRIKDEPGSHVLAEKIEQARELNNAGELEQSRQLLNELLREIATAFRTRGSSQETTARLTRRYQERVSQLDSLYSALKNVVREQGLPEQKVMQEVAYQVSMQRAADYRADRQYLQAIRQLDQLYATLARVLTRLKDKQTVEYRLVFATPKDEYEYEIRRYRTHQMLVNMKMSETVLGQQKQDEVQRLVAQSEALTQRSEQLAAHGDYNKAIKNREMATSTLVEALKQLGLYIPQ